VARRAVGVFAVWVLLAGLAGGSGAAAESGPGPVLADLGLSGSEADLAALLVAGDDAPSGTLFAAEGSRWAASGSLAGGELGLGSGESPVVRVMVLGGGSLLRLNDSGPLVLRDYFGAGGDGADLSVRVSTAGGEAGFSVAGSVRSAGSNYVNFDVPAGDRPVLAGIGAGDRFVLALARPAPEPAPSPAAKSPAKTGPRSSDPLAGDRRDGGQVEAQGDAQAGAQVGARAGSVLAGTIAFERAAYTGAPAVGYERPPTEGGPAGRGALAVSSHDATKMAVPFESLYALAQFDGAVAGGPAGGLTRPAVITMSELGWQSGGFWLEAGGMLLSSADAVAPAGTRLGGFVHWMWDAPCKQWAPDEPMRFEIVSAADADPAIAAAYADTDLGSLELDGAVLNEALDPAAAHYTATAGADTAEITVSAAAAAEQACGISISPADADPQTDGHQIDLAADAGAATLVTVTVTAADGTAGTHTLAIASGSSEADEPALGPPRNLRFEMEWLFATAVWDSPQWDSAEVSHYHVKCFSAATGDLCSTNEKGGNNCQSLAPPEEYWAAVIPEWHVLFRYFMAVCIMSWPIEIVVWAESTDGAEGEKATITCSWRRWSTCS